MTESELRQKLDLHHDKIYLTDNINYVEFSFGACFYEFFNVGGSNWTTELSGHELDELLTILNIKWDRQYIIDKYTDSNYHNVEVFHCTSEEHVFAYFDLVKDPYDQMDSFVLGIRCNKNVEVEILDKLLSIYRKLKWSTPLIYDIHNNSLYYKVFQSYFYFYQSQYTENSRKLIHHNL